jgi:uncharacterized protein
MTLIVQLKELINKPGNMKEVVLEHTLTEQIGTDVMGIAAGSTLSIPTRLESVHEGILATADFTASVTGICSRCLDEISDELEIEIQELFMYRPEQEDDFVVEQDRIDLEQALIDSVVPALPLQPLCSEDCAGLCSRCGIRMDEDPTHTHEDPIDPRFSALEGFGDG